MIGPNHTTNRVVLLLFAFCFLPPGGSAAQVYGPVTKNLGDGARATAAVYDVGGSLRLDLSGHRNGLCQLSTEIFVTGNETVHFRRICDVDGVLDDVVVEGSVEIYGYEETGSSVTFSVHLSGEAWDDTVFGRGATLGSMNDGWTNIHVPKAPSANFDRIWVDHNVDRDGRTGMLAHSEFVIDGMQGRPVNVVAFVFYAGTNQQVPNIQGGSVQVSEHVEPRYDSSRFSDFQAFIAYSDFNIPSGRTDMEVAYQVFGPGGMFLGGSERQSFYMTR